MWCKKKITESNMANIIISEANTPKSQVFEFMDKYAYNINASENTKHMQHLHESINNNYIKNAKHEIQLMLAAIKNSENNVY